MFIRHSRFDILLACGKNRVQNAEQRRRLRLKAIQRALIDLIPHCQLIELPRGRVRDDAVHVNH